MKCQALTAFRQSRILTSTDLTASPMSRSCPVMNRRRRCAICQGKNAPYRNRNARYADRPVAWRSPVDRRRSVIGMPCVIGMPRQRVLRSQPEHLPQDVGRVDSRHPPGELLSSRTPYAGNSPPYDNLSDGPASGRRFRISCSRLCTFSAPPRIAGLPIPHSLFASHGLPGSAVLPFRAVRLCRSHA